MTIVMRRAVAAGLTAHAIAHGAGFAWPWWMLEPLPSPPNNTAVIGDAAMQVTSVLWLAAAIAFVVAAVEVLFAAHRWRQITALAAAWSLALSIVCWPGSLLGVPINLSILLVLFGTRERGGMVLRR
jgi:hypothetical protein